MNTDKFRGIITPIVSPCDENDELDKSALETHFQRLLAANIDGLYINGGTGNGSRLSTEERKYIAETLIPRLKEKEKTAIVHVGQTYERAAYELARHAAELGADAVASIPPDGSTEEIVCWYKKLASAGLPVFVYYIPSITKKNCTLDELKQILSINGVCGIKMTDWNLFLLRQIKLAFPEKIVYSGYDELLSLGLFYGADGSIGTWSNLLPNMYTRVYSLAKSGDYCKIIPIQDKFTEFLSICWTYGVINSFEELMLAKGYANRCFRRPTTWNPGAVPKDVLSDLLSRIDELNKI